jgi:Undecaprenyl-phosphate galactose phosphotransferase WbaP
METILRTSDEGEKAYEYQPVKSNIWLNNVRIFMNVILILSDLASLFLAGGLALILRMTMGGVVKIDLYLEIAPIALFAIVVYAWRGLYPALGIGEVEELHRLSITTTLIFLSLATFTFLAKSPPKYSRSIFVLGWIFALVFIPLARYIIRSLLAKLRLWGEPVAVIGAEKDVAKLVGFLRENLKICFRPIVIFDEIDKLASSTVFGVPYLPFNQMAKKFNNIPIKTALVVTTGENGKAYMQLDYWQSMFERVVLVDVRNSTHLLWISVRNLGEFIGIEIRQNLVNPWAQIYKRGIDILVAIFGLVISLPVFAVAGLLIKIDSRGPVFFHQIRVGRNGDYFKMVKFRTMYENADSLLEKYLAEDKYLRIEWEKYQKLKKDPRITKIGNFLRLLSIDELPQMWNVLKGEMSLVGPRPFFPEQKNLYGEAFENYKRVRPGITGMWQIYGRNHSTFKQRAQWDEYYVRNWSVWLDIYILVRTVGAVIRQEGAY